MNASYIKSYLKYSYKALLVWIIGGLLFFLIDNDWDVFRFYIIYSIVGISRDIYHFKEKIERITALKAKGLTEQDALNIEFVKKWEQTRKDGIWKYCIRDGGIITGAGLSLAVALIFTTLFPAKFKSMLSSGPGDMLAFIGYCYITGALIGVSLFRVLWWFREKKFSRLTNPFNILFKFKEDLLNKP